MEIPENISHPRITRSLSPSIVSGKEPFPVQRRCRWSPPGRGKQGSRPALVAATAAGMPPFPELGSGAHLGLWNVIGC